MHCDSVHNAAEREKFKGCLNMVHVEQIRERKSKTRRNKFIIRARNIKDNNTREYIFRCENEQVIVDLLFHILF